MKHIAKFVQFDSDRLTLEGMLSAPASTPPTRGVLLCHPHPQYGGDMDNNVVRAVAAARNLDWDQMSDAERDAFIDDIVHEE